MKPLVRQSNFCIVLSREGEYYFIDYSSCRFRTTCAFPGRTGEEVNLEESEEEAEGGEGLQGTSPTKMLMGCSHTPEPFLLCHGRYGRTSSSDHEGPRSRFVCGPQEATSEGALLGCNLAVDHWGRPNLEGRPIPCRSFPAHLSHTGSSKKEGDGMLEMFKAMAEKTFPLLCATP